MRPMLAAAESWDELTRLLDAALSLPPAERMAWLDTLPPEHATLGVRLRHLLLRAAQLETDDFLGVMPRIGISDDDDAGLRPPTGRADDTIGPYRLIREIGSGGMGTVWLAERTDGMLNRPVALKLPHLSLRHGSLGERLAREREILATLTHPNIARIYDAGVTAKGQPYLALEYVEGMPVDEYCATRGLDLRERLRLYLQIMGAVAYAHGKLVVHRDLKPANVLVTNEGDVRLLDFGIAKLLEEGRTHETALTQLAGPAFTPEYASPEQIRGEPLGTASDIYSLGVMLFRLVTGARPYRLHRESRSALEDAVLEAEPARPSDLVAPRLRREVRGDIDTIVLKALGKRPIDRYATVNAFADDIERHLDGRPVLARPQRWSYYAGKLARRNKLAVASAALVVLAVLGGAAVAVWQARVALAERDRAEEVTRFIASVFQDADPYHQSGRPLAAAELLHNAQVEVGLRFRNRPELRSELLQLVGAGLTGLGDLPGAETALQQAVSDARSHFGDNSVPVLRARSLLAQVYDNRRDTERARAELDAILPLARANADEDPRMLVRLLLVEVDLAFEEGRWDDIEAPGREAFELAKAKLGAHDPATIAASNLLAESYVVGGDGTPADALRETERALELAEAAYRDRPHHPQLNYMREVRARALGYAGYYREAIDQGTRAIDSLFATFGPRNQLAATALFTLAGWERRIGRIDSSLRHATDGLGILEPQIARHSWDFANGLTTLGVTQISARRPAEALANLAEAEQILSEIFGATQWETLTARFHRGVALAYLGRHEEAREVFAIAGDPKVGIDAPVWFAHVDGIVKRLGGDLDGAVAAQRGALALIVEGPLADWDRVRILSELGLAEAARGHEAAGRDALSKARELSQKLEIEMNPSYAEVVAALARIESS